MGYRRCFAVSVTLVSLASLLLGAIPHPVPLTPPSYASVPGQDPFPTPMAIWSLSIADHRDNVGHDSLELDSGGRPHIGYSWGHPARDVRYAWFDGNSWISETVDSAGSVGQWTSLQLDAADRPHMVYLDTTHLDLRYAYHDGTAWITTTVDSVDRVGRFASLSLDAADRPHIAYLDESNWNLKYAHYDGAKWQIEIVDTLYLPGWYTSIAVDADDQPHIAYHDRIQGSLKYARREGTGWHVEVVDPSNYAGWFASLALDAAGRPHISYCTNFYPRYLCDDLRYASYDGTTWVTTTVDSAGWTGGNTSLALDAQGRPHIAYCHYWYSLEWSYCDELRYASFDGTGLGLHQGWQIEVVDTMETSDHTISLELDTAGRPHISYSDLGAAELRYATICTPVTGVEISGPGALIVGRAGTYTAGPVPVTATLPMTFTWDNGKAGPTSVYSWTVTGTHPMTVTAVNGCGEGTGNQEVRVLAGWPNTFFLPLVAVPRRGD